MRWLLTVLVMTMTAGCIEMPILFVELSNKDGSKQASISDAEAKSWIDAANDSWEAIGIEWTWDPADRLKKKNSILNRVPQAPPSGWQSDEIWWPSFWYALYANNLATFDYPDMNVVLIRWEDGRGWSGGPHDTQYVSMPMYTNTVIPKPTASSPNTTLLSHELGHYMGLAHTHNDYFNSAARCAGTDGDKIAVDGITLENSDGDRFGQLPGESDDVTDTPADPGAACAPTTSLNCPGGKVTLKNKKGSVVFDPPWTNIMSYHDCLPETISEEQSSAVELALEHPNRKARTR